MPPFPSCNGIDFTSDDVVWFKGGKSCRNITVLYWKAPPPPKKKRKRKKLIKEPIDIRELQHTSLVTYLLGRLASRGPRSVVLVDKALEEIELSQFNSYVVCEAFLCLTGGADPVVCFVLGFEYLENIFDFGFLFRVPCCSSVSKVMFFNFNFEHSF